ncbi:hypothetical protein GC176_20500 [bacterium]|nr:hypothetical protein [bacterium]
MATNPMISTNAGKAGLDAILDLLDVSTAGHVEIWTGSMPATPETADSGTKLATLTLSTTSFGAAVDNGDGTVKATANSITDDTNAAATGTAGYFRAKNSAGTVIIQGTVGTSNADMVLNTTSIVSGSTVSITSWTIQLPTR